MRQQGYEAAKAIVNTDAGRLSMEAINADLAVDHGRGRVLGSTLGCNSAAAAEERITLTFVIGSIVSAIALIFGSISPGAGLPASRHFGAGFASHSRQRARGRRRVRSIEVVCAPGTISSFRCSASPDMISRRGAPLLLKGEQRARRSASASRDGRAGDKPAGAGQNTKESEGPRSRSFTILRPTVATSSRFST